jgi:hypothetical protein
LRKFARIRGHALAHSPSGEVAINAVRRRFLGEQVSRTGRAADGLSVFSVTLKWISGVGVDGDRSSSVSSRAAIRSGTKTLIELVPWQLARTRRAFPRGLMHDLAQAGGGADGTSLRG